MIIYKTTNLITNKIYVGQDSFNNPKYFGSGVYIYKSIKKYGKENFKKEILCECNSKEELDEKEKYWIKTLNCIVPNGYNIAEGGGGGDTFTHNPRKEEIRKKQSDVKKGQFRSKEHNKKIGLAQIGKIMPKEQREKISKRMKENNPMKNKDTVKKATRPRGFKHSDYSKAIMANQKFGKNNPMFGIPPWNKKEKTPPQSCLCGCNNMTNPGMKYIYGHNRKGKTLPKEQCLKHSEFMKNNNPMHRSDVIEKRCKNKKFT